MKRLEVAEVTIERERARDLAGKLRAAIEDFNEDPDCVDYRDMVVAACEEAECVLGVALGQRGGK